MTGILAGMRTCDPTGRPPSTRRRRRARTVATLALAALLACRAVAAQQPADAPSDAGGELLAGRGLGDGAPAWTLELAKADAELGRDGGPAVVLRPGADGAARMAVRLSPAPSAAEYAFTVLAQGLAAGQRVNLRAVGSTEAGEVVLSTDRDVVLELDAWRRGTLELAVPARVATLELSVLSWGPGPVVVCEPSLRAVASEPAVGVGTGLDTLDAQSLAAAARSIEPRVEALRGHLFSKPVPVQVVSDSEARAFFVKRIERDYPPERAARDQLAYTQLGLWPEGVDMIEALLDLLEEQAGGFYDPDVDTFFLLSDMPGGIAPVLMAHELTHALDDQLHDIDGGIEALKDDTDASMAYASVVEGSGTLVMTVFMAKELSEGRLDFEALTEFQATEAGKAETLMSTPPLLARNLVAPYVMGQRFLLRGGGQMAAAGFESADIDRAFARPPRSSEQVLHPEKYWRTEDLDLPRPVALPDLSATLGPGWTKLHEDTLGELQLAVMTGSGMPDPNSMAAVAPSSWTNAAASGWGGDRWQLYAHEDGARHATLLVTLWDEERDAGEFGEALSVPEGTLVRREGDAVVIVAGEAGAGAEDLARAALGIARSGP